MLTQAQNNMLDLWQLLERVRNTTCDPQCPLCQCNYPNHHFECVIAEAAIAVDVMRPMMQPLANLREQEMKIANENQEEETES